MIGGDGAEYEYTTQRNEKTKNHKEEIGEGEGVAAWGGWNINMNHKETRKQRCTKTAERLWGGWRWERA